MTTDPPPYATPAKKPTKSRREILAPMLAAGMTERAIAKALDRGKTSIHQSIHKSFTKQELDAFAKTEVDELRAFRRAFLSAIGQEEIKQMLKVRGLSDYGIALDKERLILGQDSANIKPMIQINIGGRQIACNAGTIVDRPVDRPNYQPVQVLSKVNHE